MEVEDLKGAKIYLSNVEDRVKFQKKMFSLGIKWYSSDETISYLDSPFYFVDWDLRLSHGTKVDYLCFAHSSDRQIFLHDVLAIEEPKVKFKPFDKVLVRDNMDSRWIPRLFSWHNIDYSEDYPHPFETTDGYFYKYCIPYDEDLANTTKNIQ